MRNLLNKVARGVREVYHKAEDLLEDEMKLPLSQNLLNSTMKRYVTDKVEAIDDLHANIYDGWLRLFATIHYKGIQANLSTDLLLTHMQLDKDVQRLVFEQRGGTDVINITFDKPWKKIGFNLALWFCRSVIHRDPLGIILSKLNVITVKHDLLYLDLGKYLADNEKVINALRRVQVNHATLEPEQFVLKANLNLKAIFGMEKEPLSDDGCGDSRDDLPTIKDIQAQARDVPATPAIK
jgi:hypothetical protein